MLTWTPVISAYLKMLTPPTPWGLWSIVPFRPFSSVLMLAKLVFVKSESGTWLASNQWACDWLEGVVINHIQLHRPGLQVFVLPQNPSLRTSPIEMCNEIHVSVQEEWMEGKREEGKEQGRREEKKRERRNRIPPEVNYDERSQWLNIYISNINTGATTSL